MAHIWRDRNNSSPDSDIDLNARLDNLELGAQGSRSPSPPPIPPRMEDLIQAMNALTANVQALQEAQTQTHQNLTVLAGGLRAEVMLRQNREQRQQNPLPKLDAKAFPVLEISGKNETQDLSTVASWENSIRNMALAMDLERDDLPFIRVAACILGSSKGRAAEALQDIDAHQFANLNQLFAAIRQTLLGAAHPEKAYSLFLNRSQKADEDINTYHNALRNLYTQARPQAVNQPAGQAELVQRFLTGLRDKNLQQHVYLAGDQPATFNDARARVNQMCGRLDTYKAQVRSYAAVATSSPTVTPMEVDSVRKNTKSVARAPQGKREKFCRYHGANSSHTTDTCRTESTAARPVRMVEATPDQEEEAEEWHPPVEVNIVSGNDSGRSSPQDRLKLA